MHFITLTEKKYPAGLQRVEYQSLVDSFSDWCLYDPPEEASSTGIFVLHGFDGHGNQLYLRPNLRRFCLPEYRRRNYHIFTPNLRDNAWMNPVAVADLARLIQVFKERFNLKKIILDSGSMGGSSNLVFAILHPELIHAVIARGAIADLAQYDAFCTSHQAENPIFATIHNSIISHYNGTPQSNPALYQRHSAILHYQQLQDLPLFYCHGDHDALMPVSAAREFAALCQNFPKF
ncbi:MAG: alpha/beta hydrolase, partial [Lentisphaeria bacterium]